jgi:N-methylhydantoinase A
MLPPVPMRAGIDSGGTFTDAVGITDQGEVRCAKVPSTPENPAAGTRAAWEALTGGGSPGVGELRHGTTVPTNALLERRGARTALITNRGFRDVIEIGRQRRPDLYDLSVDRAEPLVPEDLRLEVGGRIAANGDEIEPLDLSGLAESLREKKPAAVAIALLHAYASPVHEEAVAAALAEDYLVVPSHRVANEFREYERTSTAVMHAYLSPGTTSYLQELTRDTRLPENLLVMRSSGGLAAIRDLAGRPADALLSGPAAGALAAADVARTAGFETAVGFDMGGTSTDVVLIREGLPELRSLTEVGGLPCLAPALAIHTVGAGGGSIARLDAGGAMHVGPASAGARPGPAAYGHGGEQPTVTDANLALGRLESLVGGGMAMDRDAARRVLAPLGHDGARSVTRIVEANMERALREVTVQQGVDPAQAAIIAFGGAGGLHAAQLCENLGAACVIVPPLSGLLSAVGLLAAPVRADRSRTAPGLAADFSFADVAPECAAVAADLSATTAGKPTVSAYVDCRYVGQSHELRVPVAAGDDASVLIDRFHAQHEQTNGYRRSEAPVEVVTLRAVAEVASDLRVTEILGQVHPRGRAGLRAGEMRQGPLLLTEDQATTWVPEGFRVRLDELGNLVLEPHGQAAS